MIYLFVRPRRALCQNILELTKARSDEKNCPAWKSRKREDKNDFIKEIAPRQTPKRSSKKRQSQPILDSIHFSGGKAFHFPLPRTLERPPLH
jgi:hypothetical protein